MIRKEKINFEGWVAHDTDLESVFIFQRLRNFKASIKLKNNCSILKLHNNRISILFCWMNMLF